jgi:hypothetical protein
MKPRLRFSNTPDSRQCDSSFLLAVQVILELYEAIRGRFVTSLYFLFTALFLFHLCVVLFYFIAFCISNLPLFFSPYSLTSSLMLLLTFLSSLSILPFPLYFLRNSPFSYSLTTSFIPFPIIPLLPSFLLLQCPVQSSYPFRVSKRYSGLGKGSTPGRFVLRSTAPRPDLEAIYPPIQWVPGALPSRGRAVEA